jgi:hypothetical protein
VISEKARNPVAFGGNPPPAIAETPTPAPIPVRGTTPRAAPRRQQLY